MMESTYLEGRLNGKKVSSWYDVHLESSEKFYKEGFLQGHLSFKMEKEGINREIKV